MQGHRVNTIGELWNSGAGGYCPLFTEEGEVSALWFRLPTGSIGRIAAVGHAKNDEDEWTIVVEQDGTVSVSPSILQQHVPAHETVPETPEWHGYLRSGVWSEA